MTPTPPNVPAEEKDEAGHFDDTEWMDGRENGQRCLIQIINQILDGTYHGKGVSVEPWESCKRRLIAIRSDAATLAEKDRQIASLQKQIDVAEEALKTIEDEDYEPIEESYSEAAKQIAATALAAIAAGKEPPHAP